MKGYDSRAVANFFVAKFRADKRLLTITQLIKLVYLAHGWHLGFTGKPLICHRVEAWKFGPVIPEVYDAFRRQMFDVRNPALIGGIPYIEVFDERAEEVMNGVYGAYSASSAIALTYLTHGEGTPWSRASASGGHYAPISDALIKEHYDHLIAEDNLEREEERGR